MAGRVPSKVGEEMKIFGRKGGLLSRPSGLCIPPRSNSASVAAEGCVPVLHAHGCSPRSRGALCSPKKDGRGKSSLRRSVPPVTPRFIQKLEQVNHIVAEELSGMAEHAGEARPGAPGPGRARSEGLRAEVFRVALREACEVMRQLDGTELSTARAELSQCLETLRTRVPRLYDGALRGEKRLVMLHLGRWQLFSELPPELSLFALGFLSPRDLGSFGAASKRTRLLSASNRLWLPIYASSYRDVRIVAPPAGPPRLPKDMAAAPLSLPPQPKAACFRSVISIPTEALEAGGFLRGAAPGVLQLATKSRHLRPQVGDSVEVSWRGKFRLEGNAESYQGRAWWVATVVDCQFADPLDAAPPRPAPMQLAAAPAAPGAAPPLSPPRPPPKRLAAPRGGCAEDSALALGPLRVFRSAEVLRYKVHYSGWDVRWDEWVARDRLRRALPDAESAAGGKEALRVADGDAVEVWCCGERVPGAWLESQVQCIQYASGLRDPRLDDLINVGSMLQPPQARRNDANDNSDAAAQQQGLNDLWVPRSRVRPSRREPEPPAQEPPRNRRRMSWQTIFREPWTLAARAHPQPEAGRRSPPPLVPRSLRHEVPGFRHRRR